MQQATITPEQSGPAAIGPLFALGGPNQASDHPLSRDRGDVQAKEYEVAKSRLSDAKFNIRDYPEPLLPRQRSAEDYYPQGVTAETEKHLQDLVKKIKTKNT